MTAPRSLLRVRTGHHATVGNVELFFDLIFVFAITQLSHGLLEHPSPEGLLHTAILLGAVWWGWIDTAWATNWLDVDKPIVRGLLFVMMGAGLVMSAALPNAFGEHGATFGLAFAFFQILRTGFVLWAVRDDPVLRENFQRILVWHAGAALLWAAGGFAAPETRLWFWLAALGIDTIAPALSFFVPGLGRSNTGDWTVEGHHLSERLSLFTIIALGESILVMGATAAGLDWSWPNATALGVSFLGSVAMWWIYFSPLPAPPPKPSPNHPTPAASPAWPTPMSTSSRSPASSSRRSATSGCCTIRWVIPTPRSPSPSSVAPPSTCSASACSNWPCSARSRPAVWRVW